MGIMSIKGGGGRGLMANAILNFIFWNLSLSSNYILWYPLIISLVALNENENSEDLSEHVGPSCEAPLLGQGGP